MLFVKVYPSHEEMDFQWAIHHYGYSEKSVIYILILFTTQTALQPLQPARI